MSHTNFVCRIISKNIFLHKLNIEDPAAQYTHLNVSRIMVKSTNFPNSGTTSDVGGIISANSKKNTVNDRRMDMLSETWKKTESSVRPKSLMRVIWHFIICIPSLHCPRASRKLGWLKN